MSQVGYEIITSFAKAYGLGATSLRYFNVAGAYGSIGENKCVDLIADLDDLIRVDVVLDGQLAGRVV